MLNVKAVGPFGAEGPLVMPTKMSVTVIVIVAHSDCLGFTQIRGQANILLSVFIKGTVHLSTCPR